MGAVETREKDLKLLTDVLGHRDELSDTEVEAFGDMLRSLKGEWATLTSKQRAWVDRVHERVIPRYLNSFSAGQVPRGREVETPDVLKHLPLKPPRGEK